VTRIVVAHRLSTVRGADEIVVLDGGRIVERGPFDELFAQQGLFSALATRQLV
jgi:ABC-type multidrug transport system fused ATPase/permease subunit